MPHPQHNSRASRKGDFLHIVYFSRVVVVSVALCSLLALTSIPIVASGEEVAAPVGEKSGIMHLISSGFQSLSELVLRTLGSSPDSVQANAVAAGGAAEDTGSLGLFTRLFSFIADTLPSNSSTTVPAGGAPVQPTIGSTVGTETISSTGPTASTSAPSGISAHAPVVEKPPVTVERVIERVVPTPGISEEDFKARIQQLDNKYASKFAEITAASSRQLSGAFQIISQTSKIDSLSSITVDSSTLRDATLSGTVTVSGALSSSNSATTTFANGINISSGCFSVNGTCVGSGGGATTFLGLTDTPSSFTANRIVHTNSAGTALTDTAGFTFDGTTLAVPYASTTGFTATSSTYLATESGNVGIGTTSPFVKLSVAGRGSFDDYVRTSYFSATSSTATSTFAGGATFATGGGLIGVGTTSPWATFAIELSTSPGFVIGNEGSTTPAFYVAGVGGDGGVGINTTGGTGRRLEVLDTASPQIRLSQNSTTYTEFQVAAATGDLTVSLYPNTTGNDIVLAQPGGTTGVNLWVCQGSACPSLTISNGGNVIAENAYYFGNGYRLDQVSGTTTEIGVYNTAGTAIVIFDEY